MKLQHKAWALVLIIVGLCAGGAMLGARHIVGASFTKIEAERAEREGERARRVLNQQLLALAATTRDYAFWGDAVHYVRGRKPAFVTDNFAADNLGYLRISEVVVFDTQGRAIATVARSGEDGLAEVPAEARRAADAPSETEADRAPPPHPVQALTRLAAQALDIDPAAIAALTVFKRSFDARKAELLAVYIVDVALADASAEPGLLSRHAQNPHVRATPDMSWTAPGHAPAFVATDHFTLAWTHSIEKVRWEEDYAVRFDAVLGQPVLHAVQARVRGSGAGRSN